MTFCPWRASAQVTMTEYPLAYRSWPRGITAGPDGAVWFTEYFFHQEGDLAAGQGGNQIGRISAGVITTYPVPTTNSGPGGITTGSDGSLWFTEIYGNNIGRIFTNGSITEFSVPTANADPVSIAAGPDGALWFTELQGNNIGRITIGGSFTEYAMPTPILPVINAGGLTGPEMITPGPDGALWFTLSNLPIIGRIGTDGTITEYAIPSGNAANFITSGPDGALWFTESLGQSTGPGNLGNAIGRITTAGVVTNEYPVPTALSQPAGIVTGPDGALWFCEAADGGTTAWGTQGPSKIGRVTTAGVFTEYTTPLSYDAPFGITLGSDDNLYYTAINSYNIGVITGVTSLQTLSFSPNPVTFASVGPGVTSAPVTITLTNNSASPVPLAGIGITGANPSDFSQNNNCPTTLAANSGCTFEVKFTPPAAAPYSADLTATYNGGASSVSASLNGTRVLNGNAAVSISQPNIDFGAVGIDTTSYIAQLYATNVGTVPAVFAATAVTITGQNPQVFKQLNFCGGVTLSPGQSCLIEVSFVPSDAVTFSATLNVFDNSTNPPSPQQVTLTGTGAQATFSVTPAARDGVLMLDFGNVNVGAISQQTVTVTNSGPVGLYLYPVTVIVGPNPAYFSYTNGCYTNIGQGFAPGQSCNITISFAPGPIGYWQGDITLQAPGPNLTWGVFVSFSGTGTSIATTLSPGTLNFGSESLNTRSAGQVATVTNVGAQTLTFNSIAITGANSSSYSMTTTCTSVAPGGSCPITVYFSPGTASEDTNFVNLACADLLNGPPNSCASIQASLDAALVPGLSAGTLSEQNAAQNMLTNTSYIQDLVTSYFQAYLNRPPTSIELTHYTAFMADNIYTDQDVQLNILSSAEFFADAGGTTMGFVNALYEDLLGRAPTTAELTLLGTYPQVLAVAVTLGLPEYDQDLVTGWFQQFLGRAPTTSELSFYTGQLQNPATNETLMAAILGSGEFFNLAQGGSGPAGPLPATLSVSITGLGAPETVNLTGTGVTGPVDETTSVTVTSTAFAYNHVQRTYSGTVTVKNTGAYPPSGELYVVLTNLTSGVTATNAAGNADAGPYYTLTAPIAPGATRSFSVVFTDPSNASITFTPRVYSGPVQ
jgi:virginiamycin B lyase